MDNFSSLMDIVSQSLSYLHSEIIFALDANRGRFMFVKSIMLSCSSMLGCFVIIVVRRCDSCAAQSNDLLLGGGDSTTSRLRVLVLFLPKKRERIFVLVTIFS